MLVGSLTTLESQAAFLRGDEPGSRRAYRSGISSEHDSGSLLAWAVPRAGEKPAGGRAVMATAESRGAVAAEILPPCQRDTGQLCLRSFPLGGRWIPLKKALACCNVTGYNRE